MYKTLTLEERTIIGVISVIFQLPIVWVFRMCFLLDIVFVGFSFMFMLLPFLSTGQYLIFFLLFIVYVRIRTFLIKKKQNVLGAQSIYTMVFVVTSTVGVIFS